MRSPRPIRHAVRRLLNGLRKVAAGLRPFSESVWPGVRNDLFVAHESIYRFACGYAAGRDVLDAGCGTGYGAALLAERALSVIGIDLDRRNIAYARRHYAAPGLSFHVKDLQELDYAEASFDLIVASNSLEHLRAPEQFVTRAQRALRPGGLLLVAVPPIYSERELAEHGRIHYHRANLTVIDWYELLAGAGLSVACVRHWLADPRKVPDFASNAATDFQPADFVFEPIAAGSLLRQLSITTIFLARSPDSIQ